QFLSFVHCRPRSSISVHKRLNCFRYYAALRRCASALRVLWRPRSLATIHVQKCGPKHGSKEKTPVRERNKFSVKFIANARPGKHCDGGGLWLYVDGSGNRKWVFRFSLNKLAREMGLGSLDLVGLAEARNLAFQARRLVHQGVDPIEARRAD